MGLVSKQRIFGTGTLVYTSPTATIPILTVQDVSLTIKGSVKKLMGANRLAEDIAAGELEVSGKYTAGAIRSGLFAAALPGATVTTGTMMRCIVGETTGAISGTTYTTSKTTGVVVLSVWDDAGKLMTPVASGPTSGQYAVTSGGVFTFAAGATGKVYTVDYIYTDATSGYTVAWSNQAQGPAATVSMYLFNKSKGKELGAYLAACVLPELSIALKNGDYALPGGTFECFDDPAGGPAVKFFGED